MVPIIPPAIVYKPKRLLQSTWATTKSVASYSLRPCAPYGAHQAPLSVGFSRQEYWSGLPYPPPGDLLDPGIKPKSLLSPTLAGRFFTTWTAPQQKQGNLNHRSIFLTLLGARRPRCQQGWFPLRPLLLGLQAAVFSLRLHTVVPLCMFVP